VNDFTGRYAAQCHSKLFRRALWQFELESRGDDYDDPDPKRRKFLLVLHSTIRGQKDINAGLSAPKELAVPERAPAFLLNGTHIELRELPP
jgi:hypothetical protein